MNRPHATSRALSRTWRVLLPDGTEYRNYQGRNRFTEGEASLYARQHARATISPAPPATSQSVALPGPHSAG